MTRRDDDIPAELRDAAAQLRALGPEEWEPATPPPLRAPVAEQHERVARRQTSVKTCCWTSSAAARSPSMRRSRAKVAAP